MLKLNKLFIGVGLALSLAGCGKEKVPEPENTAPVITIAAGAVVDEGELLTIPFTVSDNEQSNLAVTLYDVDGEVIEDGTSATLKGNVSINSDTGEVFYTAPWMSEEKTLTESFIVRVDDGQGVNGVSEQRVDITVYDISSPVEVVAVAPQGAYGYQNTQKDNLLNFWYAEDSGNVKLVFDLSDEDADSIDVGLELDEGVVFKNQISKSISSEKVILEFPVPNITSVYEDVVITLTVDDGDEPTVSTVNMTIVNKPEMKWLPGVNMISEREGGKLSFQLSEVEDYPGSYELTLTNKDGSPLTFDPGATLDTNTGTISFDDVGSFQGNQDVKVTLSLTNEIPHLGGEVYNEITTLEKDVVFVDDRDDGFNTYINEFYELSEKTNSAIVRKDEERLVQAYGNYLFLHRHITKNQFDEFGNKIASEMKKEHAAIQALSADINNSINDGEETSLIIGMIKEYTSLTNSMGKITRERIAEEVELLTADIDIEIPLALPSIGGSVTEFAGSITHYVGNRNYGSFIDEQKNTWVFNKKYKYMDVVNYSDTYCF